MADDSISHGSPDLKLERLRKYKREYAKVWRKRNPEKVRAAKRDYYARKPESAKARTKRWRAANPDKVKASQARRKPSDREWCLKKKYGLTLEAWDAMFAAQGSSCAVCAATTPGSKNGWHTDHSHATGRVRAILCAPCNKALGDAKECPERLRKLAEYAEHHAVVDADTVQFRGELIKV